MYYVDFSFLFSFSLKQIIKGTKKIVWKHVDSPRWQRERLHFVSLISSMPSRRSKKSNVGIHCRKLWTSITRSQFRWSLWRQSSSFRSHSCTCCSKEIVIQLFFFNVNLSSFYSFLHPPSFIIIKKNFTNYFNWLLLFWIINYKSF